MTDYTFGITISTLMFIVAACAFWFSKRAKDVKPAIEERQKTVAKSKTTEIEPVSNSEISAEISDGKKLRNVFSVKQKSLGKSSGSDRPFESSYYFAHNKHSTGGGYKDGLRAEDYVMNGPKLLSKGGVRVEEKKTESFEDESEDAEQVQNSVSEKRPTQKMQASTPITRYLWDDGEGNIAKIHIDTLPVTSTKTINWEDASVSSVDAKLIGDNNEGLFIDISYTIRDDASQVAKKCHLRVKKMYGSAEGVTSLLKKRKLLVKITKKPRRLSNRHSNNTGVWGKMTGQDASKTVPVAWPQLISSSSKDTEIDEDIFKKSL